MARNVFNFSSGYQPFCSYWWRHWLRPSTYTRPLLWSYQRVTRGWADCDTWGTGSHLSDILPEMLRHLLNNTHGFPSGLVPDDDVDKGMAAWRCILHQMAEGFEAAGKSQQIPPEYVTELETSTGWRAKLGVNDRDYDWLAIEKYQKAQIKTFNKGMKLFTKYFFSLWD